MTDKQIESNEGELDNNGWSYSLNVWGWLDGKKCEYTSKKRGMFLTGDLREVIQLEAEIAVLKISAGLVSSDDSPEPVNGINESILRADAHLGRCDDAACSMCTEIETGKGTVCCFGPRNKIGCKQIDEGVEEKMEELTALTDILTKADTIESYTKMREVVDTIASRVCTFVYNGHEYSIRDGAKNQSECPHCGNREIGNTAFHRVSKKATYLGTVWFGDHGARCFECSACFEKFFYHTEIEEKDVVEPGLLDVI